MPKPLYQKPFSARITPRQAQRYRREFIRRGLTQNAVGRGIGRAGTTIAKWLKGEFSSAPLRSQVDAFLEKTPKI